MSFNENGCDYSYARPPVEEVGKLCGFAMRYLSNDPSKNITPGELAALHGAGLAVGFVWEDVTGREPMGGTAQGAKDGLEAGRLLHELGVPEEVAVFWAFDYDDRAYPGGTWQVALSAYHTAFNNACGRASFPYGSNRVVDYFNGGWQTQAWSDGAVSAHAWLLQYAGGAQIPGTDKDVALYLAPPVPWLYFPSGENLSPPTTGGLKNMPTVDFNKPQNMNSTTVRTIRYLMGARGVWYDPSQADGATVRAAFKSFQTLATLKVDGICGPVAWQALSTQLEINGAWY